MGTNYYHRTNICDCCGRYDAQHICKSMTTFESPVVLVEHTDKPWEWTPTLTSWSEWKERLRSEGEVWNEYGEQIGTEQFIAQVESTLPEARRRQFDWIKKNRPELVVATPAESRDWLDEDGFSFHGGAFS